MKKLFAFLLLCGLSNPAFAEKISFEREVLAATMLSCLTPVAVNQDVADLALSKKLIEFPQEQAKVFAPKGGRVFLLPVKGNAVVIALPTGGCQVIIREVDPLVFWREENRFFGAQSPFKKVEETKTTADMTRKYTGDFHGPVMLLVSARNQPQENQFQALITIHRYKP